MERGNAISVHSLSGDGSDREIARRSHPILPGNTNISYLNEGAANVVYNISIRMPTPPPSISESYGEGTPPTTEIEESVDSNTELAIFDNQLLRLRKDLPTTVPCLLAQDAWKRLIEPLFSPEQIVHQGLVQLKPGNWVERLNGELQRSEANHHVEDSSNSSSTVKRPTHRHQVYLAQDDYGLLITDMTSRGPEDKIMEFKPKWLAQSPSAAKNSKRCRTCANTARINAEKAKNGEKLRKTFCPLDLVSSDPQTLFQVSKILLPATTNHALIDLFAQWLQHNTLLPRLRDLQLSLDPSGVLMGDVPDENLRVAMTLRDVTVYIRFPENPVKDKISDIEARIGDLDVKSKDKEAYWKNLERQLIEEGWYEGKERPEDAQPLTCSISRVGRA